MIRINLLPQKRERGASGGSPTWLLFVLGAVVLEVVGFFFFHASKEEELKAQNAKLAAMTSEIDSIKKVVADHDEVKATLTKLRAREDAIEKLQAARTGPTAVLLELGQLLTTNKGPTIDADRLAQLKKENPNAVFNPSWDTRRVWIRSYVENQRQVKLDGTARDGNDVSEFAQRLKLSAYFYDVQMMPGKKKGGAAELVDFSLQMRVRY